MSLNVGFWLVKCLVRLDFCLANVSHGWFLVGEMSHNVGL